MSFVALNEVLLYFWLSCISDFDLILVFQESVIDSLLFEHLLEKITLFWSSCFCISCVLLFRGLFWFLLLLVLALDSFIGWRWSWTQPEFECLFCSLSLFWITGPFYRSERDFFLKYLSFLNYLVVWDQDYTNLASIYLGLHPCWGLNSTDTMIPNRHAYILHHFEDHDFDKDSFPWDFDQVLLFARR